MATTVAQHQVGTITDPADGSAMSAAVMRGVSATLRTEINAHDADPGVHLQSSVAASRPAAGTAGRKWLDTDTLLVKYDNGVSWDDLAYLKASGGTLSGALTVSSGGVTVTGNSTITGTLGGLTGLTVASGGVTVTGNSSVAGSLTVTGAKATMAAAASGYASLNLPHGTAPSSPANGDLWTTTSGMFARIDGATTPLVTSSHIAPGVYGAVGGGSVTYIATSNASWDNPLRFPAETTVGTNPPTFDANRDTITINESGWYHFTVHILVDAGSADPTGIRITRKSGTGSGYGDNAGEFRNYFGGWSGSPMSISWLVYAQANSTWEVEAWGATALNAIGVAAFTIARVG